MHQTDRQEEELSHLTGFSVSYKSPKRTDLEFSIQPLKSSDAENAIKLRTDIYTKSEITDNALGLTWEENHIYIGFKIPKSIELKQILLFAKKVYSL